MREGHLGCIECESRFPIREGAAWLGEADAPARAGPALASLAARGAPGCVAGGDAGALAFEVAALLDAGGATGFLLLGPGLVDVAREVARLAPSAAVVALTPTDPPGAGKGAPRTREERAAVHDPRGGRAPGRALATEDEASREWPPPSLLHGVSPGRLPFRSGRLAGVALSGVPEGALAEAARVLGRGGRLVVLGPPADAVERVKELSLQVLAAEARGLVARRP